MPSCATVIHAFTPFPQPFLFNHSFVSLLLSSDACRFLTGAPLVRCPVDVRMITVRRNQPVQRPLREEHLCVLLRPHIAHAVSHRHALLKNLIFHLWHLQRMTLSPPYSPSVAPAPLDLLAGARGYTVQPAEHITSVLDDRSLCRVVTFLIDWRDLGYTTNTQRPGYTQGFILFGNAHPKSALLPVEFLKASVCRDSGHAPWQFFLADSASVHWPFTSSIFAMINLRFSQATFERQCMNPSDLPEGPFSITQSHPHRLTEIGSLDITFRLKAFRTVNAGLPSTPIL